MRKTMTIESREAIERMEAMISGSHHLKKELLLCFLLDWVTGSRRRIDQGSMMIVCIWAMGNWFPRNRERATGLRSMRNDRTITKEESYDVNG